MSPGDRCRHCKQVASGEEIPLGGCVDPCLGKIPGVVHACCGHGGEKDAYAVLANRRPGTTYSSIPDEDKIHLRGKLAVNFFSLLGKGPRHVV